MRTPAQSKPSNELNYHDLNPIQWLKIRVYMNEDQQFRDITEPETVNVTNKPVEQRRSAWPAGVACVCFCGLSVELLRAYGLLHWGIIHDNYSSLDGAMKTNLFRLLSFLGFYHETALLSVIFGIWAFWGQPRWMKWVCLPLIIFSLIMFLIVM